MAQPVVCAECGIRFSDQMDACPWCGHAAPQAAAPPPPPPPEPQPPRPPQAAAPPPPPPPEPQPPRPPQVPPAAPQQPQPPRPPEAPQQPPPAAPAPPSPTRPATPPGSDAPAPPPMPQSRVPAPDSGATRRIGPDGAMPQPRPPDTPRPQPRPPDTPPQPRPPASPAPTATREVDPSAASSPSDPDRLRRFGAWAAAVIGLLVIGALIAEFAPLGPLGERTEQGAAATEPVAAPTVPQPVPTETSAPADATTVATAAPATTVAPVTTPTVPPIEPIGDPIPVEQLELGETQIGELEIGNPADVVLGRLAASLGPPAADTGFITSAGDFGTCPGEQVRIVRFGMLVVVAVRNDLGEELFTSYRLDEIFADDLAAGPFLATISGLRVGDTVADLQALYSSLDVQFFDGTDTTFFELRSGDDGRLLLYGPVTSSSPEGLVRGIYSPDQCG